VPYVVFIGGVRIYEAWPGKARKGGAGLGEVRLGKEPWFVLNSNPRIDEARQGMEWLGKVWCGLARFFVLVSITFGG
jgi:hypothetical protein